MRPLNMYDVATRLGVCLPTAYRLVKSGALASCRVGKLWRVSEANLEAFISGRSPASKAADTGKRVAA
jgi:excisionase family DNA binding protein